MGEYNKAKIIKYTREFLGYTQVELADGICEVETLNRYENGRIDPSDDKYTQLMTKMGADPSRIVIVDRYYESISEKKILHLLQLKDYKAIEQIILKMHVEGKFPTIDGDVMSYQFFKRLDIVIKEERGTISREEARNSYMELLCLTVPGWEQKINSKHIILSNIEMFLLNDIAVTYMGECDNKRACEIYNRMLNYFVNTEEVRDNKQVYLILLNYSEAPVALETMEKYYYQNFKD